MNISNIGLALRSGFQRNGVYRDSGRTHSKMTEPLNHDELKLLAPAIFAEGAHESRSTRYTHISTLPVLDAMAKVGFLPFDAKQSNTRDADGSATRKGHTKHLIRFRLMADAGKSYHNGDAPIPEVVLINAHDGTSSYQMLGGMFRTLCLNGLCISDGHVETIRISHKGDAIPQVIDGAFRVLENVKNALDVHKAWRGIELNSDERMILASTAHELRFPEAIEHVAQSERRPDMLYLPAPINADQLLQQRRYEDKGQDLWTVFNVIQENCIKGEQAGFRKSHHNLDGKFVPGKRTRTKPVNGIDQDVRLNKALWAMADKMAALKGGATTTA